MSVTLEKGAYTVNTVESFTKLWLCEMEFGHWKEGFGKHL